MRLPQPKQTLCDAALDRLPVMLCSSRWGSVRGNPESSPRRAFGLPVRVLEQRGFRSTIAVHLMNPVEAPSLLPSQIPYDSSPYPNGKSGSSPPPVNASSGT